MAPFLHRPVLLIGHSSAVRTAALAALEAAKIPVLSEGSSAVDIAIVDMTESASTEALDHLLSVHPRLGVLAIADPASAVDPRVLEVVSPHHIEAELQPRVGRLRARIGSLGEAQQRQKDLRVLLELTRRYAEATDIETLLHDVTRRLAEEMEIDRAALIVVDSDNAHGTIVAASDDAALKDFRLDLTRYPEIREAVRTSKPVIVEDAPSHPLLEDVKQNLTARGIRSIAAMPLSVRGKVFGVLLLRRSSARGAFNPREVEFLTAVAHASAIAFRNVSQLESERDRREKEKTARIAAEERAAELNRYASYFSHLSDGVAILDSRACVISLNPAGLKLLDLSIKEATGRHINAIASPTDDALMLDVLLSVSKGEVRTDIDLHVRTIAGRRLVLSVSAAPLPVDGADGGAILTMRDVTRQREMADELQSTKDFLERLIDSSVDAIIAADMRGNIILFNKAAEIISGWAAIDVVGKRHVTTLYPEGVAREVMHKLRMTENGGVGRLNTSRVEILAKDGERIPVNMTASIIYEGNREVGTVGIFTDLRDRLNLVRKLTDAEARLLESEKNAVLVALAGTTAHELNQPLTSVMGYSELLKRKLKESDPSYKPVDIIYREAERMAEIVRKIGKITKFETKAYVGTQTIVDLEKASSHDE